LVKAFALSLVARPGPIPQCGISPGFFLNRSAKIKYEHNHPAPAAVYSDSSEASMNHQLPMLILSIESAARTRAFPAEIL